MSGGDIRVGRVQLDRIDYHRHNVRVDLGDLRDLTESIKRFGVMQPVVLEQRGQRLRIRAGHRRVAAARLAGLSRIPAVVHGDSLDDDEWLVAAVHENTRRKGLDDDDRQRAIAAMREQGMTWEAIGEAFDISRSRAQQIYTGDTPRPKASTGRPSVRRSTIRGLAQEAQARLDAGTWTAQDVVNALLRMADTGALSAALDPQPEREEAA